MGVRSIVLVMVLRGGRGRGRGRAGERGRRIERGIGVLELGELDLWWWWFGGVILGEGSRIAVIGDGSSMLRV